MDVLWTAPGKGATTPPHDNAKAATPLNRAVAGMAAALTRAEQLVDEEQDLDEDQDDDVPLDAQGTPVAQ